MTAPAFSFKIFLILVLMLGASLAMFLLLVRRWTTQRQWVSLGEWARQREFKFQPANAPLPAAIHAIPVTQHPQARLHLCDASATILQLQTDPLAGRTEPNRWNLVVRRTPHRHT